MLRFVQMSDLRLGSPVGTPAIEDEALASLVASDRARALEFLESCARAHRADVVLLVGDMIDEAWATAADAAPFLEVMRALSPRPVLYAHGPLDPPHATSWLTPEVAELSGLGELPANLHRFTGSVPRGIRIGSVMVTGWATAPRTAGRRVIELPELTDGATHHLVCAHSLPGGGRTLPDPDSMLRQGIRYLALGGEGGPVVMRDGAGIPRLGRAGAPAASSIPGGGGGALLGELNPDGRVEVEIKRAPTRQVHRLVLELMGEQDPADLPGRVDSLLNTVEARSGDVAWIELVGCWNHALPGTDLRQGPRGVVVRFDPDGLMRPAPSGLGIRSAHLERLVSRPDRVGPSTWRLARDLAELAWRQGEVSRLDADTDAQPRAMGSPVR